MHDVAYDNLSDKFISGSQDTGTTYQTAAGGTTWNSISTADGGDVAVDNIVLTGSSQSVRYSSFQNLGGFRDTDQVLVAGTLGRGAWLLSTGPDTTTHTISGYVRTSGGVGISGVIMLGLPGDPTTVIDGFYSADVPYGWLGQVFPMSAGLTFAPARRNYVNVTSSVANEDYVRTDPSGATFLLVDDDGNYPDVRSFYTDALDTLVITYDI